MSVAPPTSVAAEPTLAIALTVGPGDREVERLVDLAASIGAYERGPGHLVMVDDAPAPRDLAARVTLPSSIVAVALHHPRHAGPAVAYRAGKGICAAILVALGWVQANTDAALVLKLDTDSLVIGPFRDALTAAFARSPEAGVIGAYTLTPAGTPRDWSMHHAPIRAATRPAFAWRHPLGSWRRRRAPGVRRARAVFDAAIANGYQLGEHCMGGGYAVSRTLLDRMARDGYFATPEIWNAVDLPEDVMVGLHARAVGLGFANAVGPGEVFGIRYRGLAFPPEELVARGHAVIHAVKNDDRLDEATIRAFFAARRGISTSPQTPSS